MKTIPDFGVSPGQFASPNIDLNELANRLGFPSLHRGGRVIFFDTFKEGHYGWGRSNQGDGVAPINYGLLAEYSPMSIKFQSGTVGGAGQSQLFRNIYLSYPSRIGLEAGLYTSSQATYIRLGLYFSINGDNVRSELRLNTSTGVVELLYNSGWVNVLTLPVTVLNSGWVTIKLVTDFITQQYVNFSVGQAEYKTPAGVLDIVASTPVGRLQSIITVDALASGNVNHYLGHIAITVNEP